MPRLSVGTVRGAPGGLPVRPVGTAPTAPDSHRTVKEGTTRISAALRELEAHGYLSRERVRTPAEHISSHIR
ncbi:hypothetical protein GCM10010266_54080 [Streptomyces griseomycini]|nr:hypothetical protein GCM10010266_54080 [Streptomyces griseomycini]